MKNSVFASLFIEAINNADEDNGTANTISGMLNQIERKKVALRSRVSNKKLSSQEAGLASVGLSLSKKRSHSLVGSHSKGSDSNASSVFSRELKQKEYRKLVSERPYYFLSLESLIEKKREANNRFERAKLKYSDYSHRLGLRQAENKYNRVMTETEREIQLKVKERLLQGKKIPRSLLVNDGYVLSEEGIKRDERRRQLIAEEARAATAHREAISKVTAYSKAIPHFNAIQPQQTVSPIPSKNTFQVPVTEVSGDFDRALYFELLRSMSRDEAWRIAKSKTQNVELNNVSFPTGEFCYINTLCYNMHISAGFNHVAALELATDNEKAEDYLRNTIADLTTNRIRFHKETPIKLGAVIPLSQKMSIKFTALRHFNIIETTRSHHSITSRSASLQADFKTRVLHNFYHCCAVTGQKISAFLQACHIEEYALSGNMSTDNGILLSADCHRLFDENLMGIDPDRLTVHFKVPCIYSSMFEGKRIYPHRLALDKNKLRRKWEQFISK